MSQQPGAHPAATSGLNLRGAVDLSGLSRRPQQPPAGAPVAGPGAPPAGGGPSLPTPVLDVTVATFERIVQLSTTVPVVVDLWTPRSPASQQFSALMAGIAVELDGRLLLARVDVDAEPQIAQAFGVQQVPAVMAVVGGQPVPLFEGAASDAQVRQVFDQLLALAAQQGVTGRLTITGDGAEAPGRRRGGRGAAAAAAAPGGVRRDRARRPRRRRVRLPPRARRRTRATPRRRRASPRSA